MIRVSLGDKLVDWHLVRDAGGQQIFHDAVVVDLGCYSGIDALLFGSWAKMWMAVDLNAESICKVVNLGIPSVVDITHDIRKPWPIEDASVDVVVDFSTMDDIAGMQDHGHRETLRVLKEGGLFLKTYANNLPGTPRYFDARDPDDLASELSGLGLVPFVRIYEDSSRAGIACRKVTNVGSCPDVPGL